LEYCSNGDYGELVRRNRILRIDAVKFYSAQIISALEYLQTKNIFHSDLKPENIVLDENMNLKICDFATACIKHMIFDKNKMKFIPDNTDKIFYTKEEFENLIKLEFNLNFPIDFSKLVGTADYIAPEVIMGLRSVIGPQVDLWALGCIIYFSLHGYSPFKESSYKKIFSRILKLDYKIDCGVDSSAKDLISKLLVLNPYDRLGAGLPGSNKDFNSLKSHVFFKDIKWEKLNNMTSPLKFGCKLMMPNLGNGKYIKLSDSLTPTNKINFDQQKDLMRNSNKFGSFEIYKKYVNPEPTSMPIFKDKYVFEGKSK
jgi:3-phosphoinositide dependent protein kinase-1